VNDRLSVRGKQHRDLISREEDRLSNVLPVLGMSKKQNVSSREGAK
jgi:hypothetical protein